ncbi:hypothetical protein N407_01740 [Helicobacter pylori FD662]|nr:hypothetical protein N407_01740 [Helicobacter pylori FD662]
MIFINEILIAKSKKQRFLIQISKLGCNQTIAFLRFSLKSVGGILGKSLMGEFLFCIGLFLNGLRQMALIQNTQWGFD